MALVAVLMMEKVSPEMLLELLQKAMATLVSVAA